MTLLAFEPFGAKTLGKSNLQVCHIDTLGTKLSEWHLRSDLIQDEPRPVEPHYGTDDFSSCYFFFVILYSAKMKANSHCNDSKRYSVDRPIHIQLRYGDVR